MFNYDSDRLRDIFTGILKANATEDQFIWIDHALHDQAGFNAAFAMAPRKTGKHFLTVTFQQNQEIASARKNMVIDQWTIDRLFRVTLLLGVDASDESVYIKRIDNLFSSAEMNEAVALYSALPVFAYADKWKAKCAEGIRSNIGTVLEAIMIRNPYPSEYLEQPAWNQLVMKAFFTDKPINDIIGLDERRNPELANMLLDFAEERKAAGRSVNPLLWRCIAPFIDEKIFQRMQNIMINRNEDERTGVLLAYHETDYKPAKKVLQDDHIYSKIGNGEITWTSITK